MQQEFEPKRPRDILKMSRNKSFNFGARFGAIYCASKTKNRGTQREYSSKLLKNSIVKRILVFKR